MFQSNHELVFLQKNIFSVGCGQGTHRDVAIKSNATAPESKYDRLMIGCVLVKTLCVFHDYKDDDDDDSYDYDDCN